MVSSNASAPATWGSNRWHMSWKAAMLLQFVYHALHAGKQLSKQEQLAKSNQILCLYTWSLRFLRISFQAWTITHLDLGGQSIRTIILFRRCYDSSSTGQPAKQPQQKSQITHTHKNNRNKSIWFCIAWPHVAIVFSPMPIRVEQMFELTRFLALANGAWPNNYISFSNCLACLTDQTQTCLKGQTVKLHADTLDFSWFLPCLCPARDASKTTDVKTMGLYSKIP